MPIPQTSWGINIAPSQRRMLICTDSTDNGKFGWGSGFFTWTGSFGSAGSARATYAITWPGVTLGWSPTIAFVNIDSGSTGITIAANVYTVNSTTVAFKAETVDGSNLPAFTAQVLVTNLGP